MFATDTLTLGRWLLLQISLRTILLLLLLLLLSLLLPLLLLGFRHPGWGRGWWPVVMLTPWPTLLLLLPIPRPVLLLLLLCFQFFLSEYVIG